MAQGDPRQWTIYGSGQKNGFTTEGPRLRYGEGVPVIEAVLSDELVERVARALVGDGHERLFDAAKNPENHLSRNSVERFAEEARTVLRAAGFRDPGEAESDG